MAELVSDYFTAGWRERALACPCGWHGDSRAMAMELHDAVTDYACPACGNLLLIVSHPSLDQVRAAATGRQPAPTARHRFERSSAQSRRRILFCSGFAHDGESRARFG